MNQMLTTADVAELLADLGVSDDPRVPDLISVSLGTTVVAMAEASKSPRVNSELSRAIARARESLGVNSATRIAAARLAISGSKLVDIDAVLATIDPIVPRLMRSFEEMMSVQKAALERYKDLLPLEWKELSEDEWDRARRLAIDHGIATVWAPRAVVIRELINAEPDDLSRVLVAHEASVLEDAGLVLVEAVDDELEDVPELARRALEAHLGGHIEASQALSAALISTLVHRVADKNFEKSRQLFEQLHPEEVSVRRYRLAVTLRAIAKCITKADGGEAHFHRHTSVHHASLTQYSRANSIVALLLVSNLVRELSEFLPWSRTRETAAQS